jgi:hypothetical protein
VSVCEKPVIPSNPECGEKAINGILELEKNQYLFDLPNLAGGEFFKAGPLGG